VSSVNGGHGDVKADGAAVKRALDVVYHDSVFAARLRRLEGLL
jgi:hypothetical protein